MHVELTDADINAIGQRVEQQRLAQSFEAALPKLLPLAGRELELRDMYEAGVRRRLAVEKAAREQEELERLEAARRRREMWEANAPARAAREQEELRAELADLEARQAEIAARQAELEGQVPR
jgi:chromosome segregation ATPase